MCGGGSTFDGVGSSVLYRVWIALFVEFRAAGPVSTATLIYLRVPCFYYYVLIVITLIYMKVLQWPFEVTECGWGEFQAKISLHFKDKDQKPVEVMHAVKLHWPETDPSRPQNLESRKAPDGSLLPVVHEQYDEVRLENVDSSSKHISITCSLKKY